jgi:hypothetical protein
VQARLTVAWLYKIQLHGVTYNVKLVLPCIVCLQGFQIRPDAPFVKRVWLTFQEVPRVRFAAEAVKGMDISGNCHLL